MDLFLWSTSTACISITMYSQYSTIVHLGMLCLAAALPETIARPATQPDISSNKLETRSTTPLDGSSFVWCLNFILTWYTSNIGIVRRTSIPYSIEGRLRFEEKTEIRLVMHSFPWLQNGYYKPGLFSVLSMQRFWGSDLRGQKPCHPSVQLGGEIGRLRSSMRG